MRPRRLDIQAPLRESCTMLMRVLVTGSTRSGMVPSSFGRRFLIDSTCPGILSPRAPCDEPRTLSVTFCVSVPTSSQIHWTDEPQPAILDRLHLSWDHVTQSETRVADKSVYDLLREGDIRAPVLNTAQADT